MGFVRTSRSLHAILRTPRPGFNISPPASSTDISDLQCTAAATANLFFLLTIARMLCRDSPDRSDVLSSGISADSLFGPDLVMTRDAASCSRLGLRASTWHIQIYQGNAICRNALLASRKTKSMFDKAANDPCRSDFFSITSLHPNNYLRVIVRIESLCLTMHLLQRLFGQYGTPAARYPPL